MFWLINAVWDAKSFKLFDKSNHIVISNVHILFKRALTPTELSINWFLALIYISGLASAVTAKLIWSNEPLQKHPYSLIMWISIIDAVFMFNFFS